MFGIIPHSILAIIVNRISEVGIIDMMRDEKMKMSTSSSKLPAKKIPYANPSLRQKEVFACIEKFDDSFFNCHALSSTNSKKPDFSAYTDRQSLNGRCVSLAQIAARFQKTNLSIIFKANYCRDISNIICIEGTADPVNDLARNKEMLL